MTRPPRPLAHLDPDCAWRRPGEAVPATLDGALHAHARGDDSCPLCVLRTAS